MIKLARETMTPEDLLAEHRGIVFGDEHPDPAITAYLGSRMGNLSRAGAKVLFLEMFQDTPEQRAWVNAFNEGRTEHDEDIKQWLKKAADYPPRTPEDYMDMYREARKHHIKLAPMNTTEHDPFHHIASSNTSWEKTIRSYLDRPEVKSDPDFRYAVFCGRSHTHFANQQEDEVWDQTTGIDKRLGIPAVTFSHMRVPAKNFKTTMVATDEPSNTYCVVFPQLQVSMAASGQHL